jgi:hypothetical protein
LHADLRPHRTGGVGHRHVEHLAVVAGGARLEALRRGGGEQVARPEQTRGERPGARLVQLVHRPREEDDGAPVPVDVRRFPEMPGRHRVDQRVERGAERLEVRAAEPTGILDIGHQDRAIAHPHDAARTVIP